MREGESEGGGKVRGSGSVKVKEESVRERL